MSGLDPLDPDLLWRVCDPDSLGFQTTEELSGGERWVGQDRLTSALRFGLGVQGGEYHIFALGPRETDKRIPVETILREHSEGAPVPPDLCYVRNFEDPYRPRLLILTPGQGAELGRAMDEFVSELEPALVAAFESEEYQNRRQALQEAVQEEQGEEFEELREKARDKGFALIRTPGGFGFLPRGEDGDVMEEEEIRALSEEEKSEYQERVEGLQSELQAILRTVPARQREVHAEIRKLDREIATYAVSELVEGVRKRFRDQTEVQEFLDVVQEDVVRNARGLLQQGSGGEGPALEGSGDDDAGAGSTGGANPVLTRYLVNVLVSHGDSDGAPVVHEEHPTYKNLVGRIEHRSRMGALTTNFTLIRPGALHRANGGTLVLDARSLLMEPFAWEALKRVLTTGRLKIESMGQGYSPISTVGLEPEPVALDVKVVLVGERMIYYLLCARDPEFQSLFRVEADFEDQMPWGDGGDGSYARFLAALIRERELRPFDAGAVARVIEEGARMSGDRERLSLRTHEIEDLLQQTDHWAGEAGREAASREDVERAVEQAVYRGSRVRDRAQEQILRDTVLISTEGQMVGQINGLSVMQLGKMAFGRPTRITARVGLGRGEIVDIEREVEMGGPLHSKGVLILKGLLAERYARKRPLSLSASLVFEQSYGGVDGDSASVAELLTLLSAIGRFPLAQHLAVTGSVNQHGRVQAIGGVNQKIEGFFEICRERGLTGEQGVVIPQANVKHLMLRDPVVEAVRDGLFRIWAVEWVDQAIEVFTGMPAGTRLDDDDETGRFTEGSVNDRVDRALEQMAERIRAFGDSDGPGSGPANGQGNDGA